MKRKAAPSVIASNRAENVGRGTNISTPPSHTRQCPAANTPSTPTKEDWSSQSQHSSEVDVGMDYAAVNGHPASGGNIVGRAGGQSVASVGRRRSTRGPRKADNASAAGPASSQAENASTDGVGQAHTPALSPVATYRDATAAPPEVVKCEPAKTDQVSATGDAAKPKPKKKYKRNPETHKEYRARMEAELVAARVSIVSYECLCCVETRVSAGIGVVP